MNESLKKLLSTSFYTILQQTDQVCLIGILLEGWKHVKIRKLLSAHKSHVREISLFTAWNHAQRKRGLERHVPQIQCVSLRSPRLLHTTHLE